MYIYNLNHKFLNFLISKDDKYDFIKKLCAEINKRFFINETNDKTFKVIISNDYLDIIKQHYEEYKNFIHSNDYKKKKKKEQNSKFMKEYYPIHLLKMRIAYHKKKERKNDKNKLIAYQNELNSYENQNNELINYTLDESNENNKEIINFLNNNNNQILVN